MQHNLDGYQLARDRTRRDNPTIPPRATQSQDALAAQRARNEKRSYAQIVKTRPQPAGEGTVTARTVLEPSLHEPIGNRSTDGLNARNAVANPYLQHIAVRDARAPHRTPSPPSPLVNHVPSAPQGRTVVPDTAVPAAPAPAPATVASEARPIATTSQGRNTWPGITIGHQAGEVIRSQFAGEGRATQGPCNVNAIINVAPPLHRTNIDTIVPGTPLPQRPRNPGLALSQPVPNTHIAPHRLTNNTHGAAIHPQTSLGRVALSQPLPPPAMTPPGPRPRKQRPTHDGAPASQSDGTSSSAPVTTPTHTPTGGMTATSTTYIQVHGNTVRAQSVRTGFNFGGANLLSNANVPIRYKLQATRMSNGQPGLNVPFPIPSPNHRAQQPVASPSSNPFFIPTTGQAPHQPALLDPSTHATSSTLFQAPPGPPMANRPVTTVQNYTLPIPHGPAPQSQGLVAHPPLVPSRPPMPLQPQPQAPSYIEYTSQHALAMQYLSAPQPTTAWQLPAPQLAQLQIGQVAPQPLPQLFGVHPALLLPQQPLTGQQVYVPLAPPLPANPVEIPQAPLAPAPPMEVDGHDGAQDEQGAVVVAAGGAPPGGGPNLPVFRPSTISSYPHETQPVIKTFVGFYRVWNFATGLYEYASSNPNDRTPPRDEMGFRCWVMANQRHGTVIPFDPDFMKVVDAAVCALRSVSKSYMVPVVHHYFGFRVGDPEFNKALKERALPDRFHCGQFEEEHRLMESDVLAEAIRIVAFQTTNSIGFRNREHFTPINDRLFTFVCTLIYHIIYCYCHGDYQHENLCAPQQQAIFAYYMRVIEKAQIRWPNRLYNLRIKVYDYCMRSLVEPDPEPEAEEVEEDREMSPDTEEIAVSQYASHFTAPAQPAPVAPAPRDPPHATPTRSRPAGDAEHSPVGHASVSLGGGDSWEIVTHADGSVFLVGPHETAQIDPVLVDNLLNLRISPPHALQIATQAPFSPTVETSTSGMAHNGFDESLHAGPSGLTAAEKEAAAAAGATTVEVTDGAEASSNAQDKGKSEGSTFYGRQYLNEYDGVEPGEVESYTQTELPDDFEPVLISDEEMELEQDD